MSLQRRLPSREIAVLMTTLIIQQRAGGDVVRALQDLSDTLDKRRETLREVATIMAGAVYTSYIVPILGLGALLLLNTINPQTLDRMTSEPVGIVALVVAGIALRARVGRDPANDEDRVVIDPALTGLAGAVLLRRSDPRAGAAALALGGRAPRAQRGAEPTTCAIAALPGSCSTRSARGLARCCWRG